MSTKKDRLKIILNRAIGLFLISLLLSFFWLVPVLANTGWIGTIQYTENYHKDYQYATGAYNIHAYCRLNKTVNIVVNVCFQEGKIIYARASAHYEADHQERCLWSQDHAICCGDVPIDSATSADRKQGCHKTTGNKGDVSYGWSEVKMGEPDIENVYLRVHEDGRYTLGMNVSLPICRSYTRSGSTQFACSGESKKEPSPDPDIISVKHFSFTADANVGDDGIIKADRIFYQTDQAPPGPHSCFISGCGRDGPVLPGDEDAQKKEYYRREKASWQFKKACFGVITQSEGDVRIIPPEASGELSGEWIGPEGWPAQPGCVEAQPGTTIKTGSKSRVEISSADGTVIRLGSNSEVELSKLCMKAGPGTIRIIDGRLRAFLKKLIPDTEFKVITTNAVNGVRGQAPKIDQTRFAQALIEGFLGLVWAAEPDPLDLSAADLTNFALAVQVERYPGLLNVKALKGTFFIHYHNMTKQLSQGQEFTKRWEEPVDPSDYIEVRITADQFPNKDGVPNSNPCEYLEYMHSKMQETLERCEAIAEEQSGIQQQCESLKQQIEQLEQTIKQQCP